MKTERRLWSGAVANVRWTGGPGVHDGKAVGIIANTYEVELPGFEGKQPVQVEYTQRGGTIIGFKGPGFLYRAEGGQLVRKKLVRLSSHDITVLEKGIREAIDSHGYAKGQHLFLVLCKDKASFPPSESFLERLSDLDVALKNYRDWDPRQDRSYDQAVAEVVPSTPDCVKFCWKELSTYEDVKRQWACKFKLRDGNWTKED